jgi:hypothetical protein
VKANNTNKNHQELPEAGGPPQQNCKQVLPHWHSEREPTSVTLTLDQIIRFQLPIRARFENLALFMSQIRIDQESPSSYALASKL